MVIHGKSSINGPFSIPGAPLAGWRRAAARASGHRRRLPRHEARCFAR